MAWLLTEYPTGVRSWRLYRGARLGDKETAAEAKSPDDTSWQRHNQRMAQFGTARGDTPGSDPGPIHGHPAEDWAEW